MSDEPTAKRPKVAEEDTPLLLPSELEGINKVQTELDALNDQAGEEIVKIEQKYNALRAPIYAKRTEAIRSISNFWGNTFLNHPQLSASVAEIEKGFIQHIRTIEVDEFADIKSGYKIKFAFNPNEYIENEVIEKEFHLAAETPFIKMTPIVWKEGHNLLEQIAANRHPVPSDTQTFTEWLVMDSDPTMDDIAEIIKDDLWPNPVQYFLIPDMEDEDGDEVANGDKSTKDAVVSSKKVKKEIKVEEPEEGERNDSIDASNGEPEHCRRLFIGGLTPNTTEEMMRGFYSRFGRLMSVVLPRSLPTNESRRFCYVTYAAKSMVDECQKARPHVIDGKAVDPKRAVPRDKNDRGAGNVSSKRLYVSGIREDHTDEMLQDYFAKFGNIEKVDLITDKATNKNRGFAFVTFDDYDCVDQCVILESHYINGHRCDVKKGLSKEETAKAQQTERDRMERTNRSHGMDRGGPMMGGGGGYDQRRMGGGGGGWGGYGGGPQQRGGGGWGGYGGQQGGYGGQQGGYGGQQGGYGGQQGGYGEGGQIYGQQTEGRWGMPTGGGGGGAWSQGQQEWAGPQPSGADGSRGAGGYGSGVGGWRHY